MRGALSSIFCQILEESKEGSLFFLENGSKLLEEIITQSNGRSKIQIRNFSAKEIVKATNHFDSRNIVWRVWASGLYKGSFQKRPILVKKYLTNRHHEINIRKRQFAIRDMAISLQMSFHKNALTLIGYCLEFDYPALVYRSPDANDDGCLFYSNELKLTWEKRISMAYDIANVLAYLHTGFSTPFIHRNIRLQHFVLDKHGTAKLVDFSLCIQIPLGECQVEDEVKGTIGRIDPIYLATGVLTEKADVFNVGAVFFELFTGKEPWDIFKDTKGQFGYSSDGLRSYFKRGDFENMVTDDIVIEEGTVQTEQLRAFAVLALKCFDDERENRPEMVDVVKELRRIQRLGCPPSNF